MSVRDVRCLGSDLVVTKLSYTMFGLYECSVIKSRNRRKIDSRYTVLSKVDLSVFVDENDILADWLVGCC